MSNDQTRRPSKPAEKPRAQPVGDVRNVSGSQQPLKGKLHPNPPAKPKPKG